MRRLLTLLCVASLAGCVQTRTVAVSFGANGEGLDGFLCEDTSGQRLISRAPPGGMVSLVVDFVTLGGVPGCRTGQLMEWCKTHDCRPHPAKRSCVEVPLEVRGTSRPEVRAALLESLRAAGAKEAVADAPDEFVLVRIVGTTQPCTEVTQKDGELFVAFDPSKLLGCAYSCPVLLDHVEDDVYLGFDTLTASCESGVRTCADRKLQWQN
ncbi:MAG: hypothetical protein ACOZQL_22860 [Myxococcota bacterium]